MKRSQPEDDRSNGTGRRSAGLGAVRLGSARRSVQAARPSDVIFPKRKSMRAEDVEVEPWLGDIARRWWSWWGPRLEWGLGVLRRWWVVPLAGLVVLALVHEGRARLRADCEAARAADVQRRADRAVHAVLALIGHGVRVSAVLAKPMPEYVGGSYENGVEVVTFNSEGSWSEPELLYVSGHECVHALFDQAELSRYGRGLRSQVLEESAAVVLGGHLAGRVYTKRGHDGPRLTREVVERFRAACSRRNLHNPKEKLVEAFRTGKLREMDPAEVEMTLNHFGNERLVTDLDRICRNYPDPWEASHEIFRHFKMDRKWQGPELPGYEPD